MRRPPERILKGFWSQLGSNLDHLGLKRPADPGPLGVLAGCLRQAFVPKPPQDPPQTPQDPPKTSPRHPKTPQKPHQDLQKCFNNHPKSLPEPNKNEVQIQKKRSKDTAKTYQKMKYAITTKDNGEYLPLLALGAIMAPTGPQEPKIAPKPGSRYHPGPPKLDPKIDKNRS